jgi:Mor family transcriptional regulator
VLFWPLPRILALNLSAGGLMVNLFEVAKDIIPDDMPSAEMKEIFDLIGPDAMVKLATSWSGVSIYFPRDVLIGWKRRHIVKEFTGANSRELARRYNVSVRWVYTVIGENALTKIKLDAATLCR